MKHSVIIALRTVNEGQLAAIALQMAEKHPITFEKLLFDAVPAARTQEKFAFDVPFSNGTRVHFTQTELNQLRAISPGNKIAGIKLVREITGLGLKEAKDLVEAAFIPNS